MELVGKEILEQRADYIHYRLSYPNGLVLEFEVKPEGINVNTNKPLQEISPGVFKPVI
ncbi:hypothetical protein B4098_3414 [Heyndrickxia coagulans]|uniref:Uncharacterized protein n=2 Tax=Heyndrickxia coagulans TaxID=1398 RepID=A0A150K5W7_HEYCO|nr:hypothetical protein B4098_3414 [Heyndrickxia coagulans]